MSKIIDPKLNGRGRRIAVIVSHFNDFITQSLLDGCLAELSRLGVAKSAVTVVWVPGAFELPVTALKLAKKRSVDAVICLGAVIRGETFHFELVAENAARGIQEVALQTGKPVIFGVLTTETINQATARAEENGDNKGRDAAQVAVQMAAVLKQLSAC